MPFSLFFVSAALLCLSIWYNSVGPVSDDNSLIWYPKHIVGKTLILFFLLGRSDSEHRQIAAFSSEQFSSLRSLMFESIGVRSSAIHRPIHL